ncbi:MAG: hypothetical protein NXI24_00845 [bacterium]|nr:hypothetical protein [bacterium]
MKDLLQIIMRAGAWVIILLLVGMMAITFTGQDLNVTGALANRGGVGSYDGETIKGRDYSYHYNVCNRQATLYRQQFGDLLGPGQSIDSFFNLNDCVRRSLQQAYVLPTIAERMGLGVSMESVRKQAQQEAITQARQQEGLLEEDRMTPIMIYERSLQNFPLELRRRQAAVDRTGQILNETITISDEAAKARWLAGETGVALRLIRFNNPGMLAKIKKTISVTEEEVRTAFAEEQAKRKEQEPDAKPKAFEDEQAFVQDRLKTKLARKQLEAATKKVDELTKKGAAEFRLEDVAGILDVDIFNAGRVKLQELGGVPAGGGSRANLSTPEFLKVFGQRRSNFTAGPFTDGEFIVYVEVQDVSLPGSAAMPAAKKDEIKEQAGRGLTGQFYQFLVQEESLRGQFRLTVNADDVQ